ncbi:MAG: aminoglycoside phosphotransferase family protein [Anaerolineales bacterium]|nr:aminoglycoside phosphotransferase family protein [Anaerolineales bacterium]
MAWPFSTAELTAGLRRYLAEPALQVAGLSEQPLAQLRLPGRAASGVRGLRVTYRLGGETFSLDCVVKELLEALRPGLSNPGVREAGLYRALAAHLPMPTPALIAADQAGSWLVLEAVEAEAPAPWDLNTFGQALALLARLHERFWDLADDLSAYPWLARPFTLDFEVHVYSAAQALGQVVRDEWPPCIAASPQILGTIGQMISQAERLAAPLRALPATLLHGEFWAGNLVRDADGDLIVLDWQLAAIGPGVLDLVVMIKTTEWANGELPAPADRLAARYRREIARLLNRRWSDADWAALWDSALLWRFLQEMLPWSVSVPRAVFAARAEAFDEVWLRPALAAAARRLPPFVPLPPLP